MANASEPIVTRIPAAPRSGRDIVDKLRQTSIGRLYVSHLKHFPAIRSFVIWIWKNSYPVYLKYLVFAKSKKWRKLVRSSDYVKSNSGKAHVLIESCVIETSVPRVFPIADQVYLESQTHHYTFPNVQLTILQNAIQYGGTNLVVVGDSVVCHDLYDFELDYTSEELHGRALIDPKHDRIRWMMHDDAPETIYAAATFVDACAANYAHWMTEVLPRIVLFCADDRFRQVPIVVNDGLHKNIMESLYLAVGAGREIIVLPIGRALVINELYLISMTGYVPFERRVNMITGHSQGLFCPEALTRVSQRLSGKISNIKGSYWPKKIYLRRNSGTRKITNNSAIEQLLSSYGFAIVEPEKLAFAEQVLLFMNAKIIIGPTGAAFATAIFCRGDAQVTVLMSKHENMIYRYWCNMLSPLGITVNYILGNIAENHHLGFHGDFEVAMGDLIELLETIGIPSSQKSLIHPSAQVSPEARLGEGVEIGPFSIIHGNVVIGDRVKVGAYCEMGISTPSGDRSPLIIGDDAVIRSHSVFYESSSFGAKLVTGHHVIVRESTIAGIAFQIGANCEIQGDCSIGDYVRFQSNVFVGKKTIIGNFVWVLPYVILTNDPTPPSDHLIGCNIEDYASLSAASVVLPGVTVGHHALVAAQACVTKDVPPFMVVAGVPAYVVRDSREIKLRDSSGRPAYPWTRHFTRGYPDSVVDEWKKDGE